MNLKDILGKLEAVQKTGNGFQARCPVHDDQKASLSVTPTDDRILFHCHAGCDYKSIVDSIGVNGRRPSSRSSGKLDFENPVSVFDYRDESGTLLYQSVRFRKLDDPADDKNIRQRKPKNGGGWDYKLGKTKKVLYRLPELLESDVELLCIADPDVERLRSLGLTATCNSGGAGKWDNEYSRYFEGRDVAIFADCDEAGWKHAEQVAASMVGSARLIKVIHFDEMPNKSDVTDWLETGKTKSDLSDLIEQAPEWIPAIATDDVTENVSIESQAHPECVTVESGRSDAANATRFVNQFGHQIRFVPEWNHWLVWDGRRWKLDQHSTAMVKLARDYSNGLWSLVSDIAEAGSGRNDFGKVLTFIGRTNNLKPIQAFLKLAQSDDRVILPMDQLNQNPHLLNLENGTVNLKTGRLHDHNPQDNITQIANCSFDESAKCPTWRETLEIIFDQDFELIEYVQKLLGYSISGDIGEHLLPICYGSGENGKSTLWNPIIEILGDYATLAPESLLLGYGREHPTEKALLYQKRFVAVSEPDENARLKESRVKELTGDDWITARRMGEDFWTFRRTHTFWISTNHLPTIRGTDNGIWRRVKLIPFNIRIRDRVKEVKKDFVHELVESEGSGILNWLVMGFRKYFAEGLDDPKVVVDATEQYRQSEDLIGRFVNDCCDLGNGLEATAEDLFHAFESWDGFDPKITKTKFGKAIGKRFQRERKSINSSRKLTVYIGLKISNEPTENNGF